jgi:hypothetical protein
MFIHFSLGEMPRKVAIGCLAALALVMFISACSKSDSSDPPPGSASKEVEAAVRGLDRGMTAAMKSCDEAVNITKPYLIGMAEGQGSVQGALAVIARSEATCRETHLVISRMKVPDALSGKAKVAAEKAIHFCTGATAAEEMYLKTLKELIDSDGDPSKFAEIQKYPPVIQADAKECGAEVLLTAKASGVVLDNL